MVLACANRHAHDCEPTERQKIYRPAVLKAWVSYSFLIVLSRRYRSPEVSDWLHCLQQCPFLTARQGA